MVDRGTTWMTPEGRDLWNPECQTFYKKTHKWHEKKEGWGVHYYRLWDLRAISTKQLQTNYKNTFWDDQGNLNTKY